MKVVIVFFFIIAPSFAPASPMQFSYFPAEIIQSVLKQASDEVVINFMQTSRLHREICQKNIWPLHYAVVKNNLPDFIHCVARGCDLSKAIHGLTCFDLAIMYERNDFINFMCEKGILSRHCELFQKIRNIGCFINMAPIITHGHNAVSKPLKHTRSVLDHSAISRLVLPEIRDSMDIQCVIDSYLLSHQMLSMALREAVGTFTLESGDSRFNKKDILQVLRRDIISVLDTLGFRGDVNEFFTDVDSCGAEELCKILNVIADLLYSKVEDINEFVIPVRGEFD